MHYDALQDRHLSRFFTRPTVEKHLRRIRSREAEDRQPTFLREFSMYFGSSSTAPMDSACVCEGRKMCFFCRSRQQRAALVDHVASQEQQRGVSPMEEFFIKTCRAGSLGDMTDGVDSRSNTPQTTGRRSTSPINRPHSAGSTRSQPPAQQPSRKVISPWEAAGAKKVRAVTPNGTASPRTLAPTAVVETRPSSALSERKLKSKSEDNSVVPAPPPAAPPAPTARGPSRCETKVPKTKKHVHFSPQRAHHHPVTVAIDSPAHGRAQQPTVDCIPAPQVPRPPEATIIKRRRAPRQNKSEGAPVHNVAETLTSEFIPGGGCSNAVKFQDPLTSVESISHHRNGVVVRSVISHLQMPSSCRDVDCPRASNILASELLENRHAIDNRVETVSFDVVNPMEERQTNNGEALLKFMRTALHASAPDAGQAPAVLKGSRGQRPRKETERLAIENTNACGDPETFVLIRFTMRQFTAAGLIQRWYRGCRDRRWVSRMQRAATRIQRAFKRFANSRRTAVAVWTLEKNGRCAWSAKTKFARVSAQRSSLLIDDRRVDGQSTTVDYHNAAITSLSQMMTLFITEPQGRVALWGAEMAVWSAITSQFYIQSEAEMRRAVLTEEEASRMYLFSLFVTSMRFSQQQRKTKLLEDVNRQKVVKLESCEFYSIVCDLVTERFVDFVEPEQRGAVVSAEASEWFALLDSYFSSSYRLELQSQERERHHIEAEERNCYSLISQAAVDSLTEMFKRFQVQLALSDVHFREQVEMEEHMHRVVCDEAIGREAIIATEGRERCFGSNVADSLHYLSNFVPFVIAQALSSDTGGVDTSQAQRAEC